MCYQISALKLLYGVKIAPLENQLNVFNLIFSIVSLMRNDEPAGLTVEPQQHAKKKRKSQSGEGGGGRGGGGTAPSRSFYNINVFTKKLIEEILNISKRISGIMLKFGIPLYFMPWSEHYRKSQAYVEELRKSVSSFQHLSNQPSRVSLDIIKQARDNYDSWCRKCEQLETTNMDNVQKEELIKMFSNHKSMQDEQRDYSSLWNQNLGPNILNNQQYKLHALNSDSLFPNEVWSDMQKIIKDKNTVLKSFQDTFYSILRQDPNSVAGIFVSLNETKNSPSSQHQLKRKTPFSPTVPERNSSEFGTWDCQPTQYGLS